MVRLRIPRDIRMEAVRRYRDGQTLRELERWSGYHPHALRHDLRMEGVELRAPGAPPTAPPADLGQQPDHVIAQREGVSRRTVARMRAQQGVLAHRDSARKK